MEKKKVIKYDIIAVGDSINLSNGKSIRNTAYVVVDMDGEQVRLPITQAMAKDAYDTNKVKLTIEIV